MELIVRTGPQEYECREGVLETLVPRLMKRHIRRLLIVHGRTSWQKAAPFLAPLYHSELELEEVLFAGECTDEEVERICQLAADFQADAVMGVGGGKIMDTVKYASQKAGFIPSVLVPTLASNCAPWTPISVLYSAEGVFQELHVLEQQVSLLLVEPALTADAPVEFFIAGMADTLAKWYESDAILSLPQNQSSPMLQMARHAARICRDDILRSGTKAAEDFEKGHLSDQVKVLMETIISVGGLTGGLGDDYARTTAAHDIHDALTLFPAAHRFLHGHKVAYGIMAQLALEKKWNEIDRLIPFYRGLQLPFSLKQLQLESLTETEWRDLAEMTVQAHNAIHHLPYPVTAQEIIAAMKGLESYVSQQEHIRPLS